MRSSERHKTKGSQRKSVGGECFHELMSFWRSLRLHIFAMLIRIFMRYFEKKRWRKHCHENSIHKFELKLQQY